MKSTAKPRYGISVAEVNAAIGAQVAAGGIGAAPTDTGQELTTTVLVEGQLADPETFGDIVLRANPDGANLLLKDIARAKVGGENYNTSTRLNGQWAAAIGVQLSPTGNAVATSEQVRAAMDTLAASFPEGIASSIPYDTSSFVEASIEKVVHTPDRGGGAGLHHDVRVPSEHSVYADPDTRGADRPSGHGDGDSGN